MHINNSDFQIKNLMYIALFLLLNILKVLFFHAEIVEYQQDFSNVVYVSLFVSAWTVLFSFLLLKRHRALLLGFYILQFVYISVNYSYFLYYDSYLSIHQAASLLGEFGGLVNSNSIPLHPKLLLFLIDLPALVLIFRRSALKQVPKLVSHMLIAAAAVMLVLLYSYKFVMTADSITKSDRARYIGNYGLLTLQIHDYLVADDYLQLLNPSDRPLVTGSKPSKTPKNVILIQVEALDANILQFQFNGRPVMPNLLRLSQENIFFPYVLSYHKGGGTSDAEFSILNSVEPLDTYAAINLPDYPYKNSVVKELNENGYYTAAFHGNVGKYWNRTKAFSAMGFDEFYDIEAMNLPEYGWGARDEDLFSFVEKQLNFQTDPFFYLVITMSSHGPYKNVKRYYNNDRFSEVPKSNNDQAYLNSMAYVDKEIEKFLNNTRDELSDCFVFIYGDHSEYYSESGFFSRGSKEVNGDRLEFVPLIIIPPEGFDYQEPDIGVSFLDFAPTILEAANADYELYTHGTDVLDIEDIGDTSAIPFKGSSYERTKLLEIGYSTK